LSLDGMYDKL